MSARALVKACVALVVVALSAPKAAGGDSPPTRLSILSPQEGAVFPRDFAAPTIRWKDEGPASQWRVKVEFAGESPIAIGNLSVPEWRLAPEEWELIKSRSVDRDAKLVVTGLAPAGKEWRVVSSAAVSFRTSHDAVGAPIFYREVPLPVGFSMDNKPLITWKLGDVSSGRPPRTVLSGMHTCANCHSFSGDGKTLAMDIDFGTDKSTYAIAEIGQEVTVGKAQMITWNDFKREDGQATLGLLSSISPDGRHVVSTVKETIGLTFMPDPYCSQVFFPVRGILAVYDRGSRSFRSLAGADDPAFVQTNPAFSPDGRWLVFARARVPDMPPEEVRSDGGLSPEIVNEYADGRRVIQYDLYRLPFNEGRGGTAEPVPGASKNGSSNYFARYSPDGRWIVFCKAGSMMLNRPDSAMYILPAEGGTPRRLRGNAPGRMNSWHSFSPNGRWLVYASKAAGPMTQMWLTHIDSDGNDSVPVMLDGFVHPTAPLTCRSS
jgi:hypothetical protein